MTAKQTPLADDLPHPMQPVGWDRRGVIRFKQNAIIDWLFETRKLDLNEVAMLAAQGKFTDADQMQLAQLLGYSGSGYGDLSPLADDLPHPMQPVGWDRRGVVRFKQNGIIQWLFETRKLDLDEVAKLAARGKFSAEDQMQLAQLLGYSVSGYGDLSYVSQASLEAADQAAQRLTDATVD